MKIPKPKTGTIPLTIRISPELHEKLTAAAVEQDWTINAEINHRLRATPVIDQLKTLTTEIAELRAQVRHLEALQGE